MVKFRIKAPHMTKKTLRKKRLRRKTLRRKTLRKKRLRRKTLRKKTLRRKIKKPQNCNYQREELTKKECQDCVNRGGKFIIENSGLGQYDCLGATTPNKRISAWNIWK